MVISYVYCLFRPYSTHGNTQIKLIKIVITHQRAIVVNGERGITIQLNYLKIYSYDFKKTFEPTRPQIFKYRKVDGTPTILQKAAEY